MIRMVSAAGVVLASLFMSLSVNAQVTATNVQQILDSVFIAGYNSWFSVTQEEPVGFEELVPPDASYDFIDCDASTARGLTCLVGNDVRVWSQLSNTAITSVPFSCANPALPFNTRRDPGCTAVARDSDGAFYLGGRLNGTANVVIKVIRDALEDSVCPASYVPFSDSSSGTELYFCAAELATGRPVVEDIDVLEGALKRLLVLEEKKTALVYSHVDPEDDPIPTVVDEVAGGKQDFVLIGNEQVLNAALYEYVRPDDETNPALVRPGESDFFVVVTTDRGRIIAVDTQGSPAGKQVFDLVANRGGATACAAGDDSFDLTFGTRSGLGYATDRNFCLAHVLQAQADTNGDLTGFIGTTDPASPLTTSVSSTLYSPVDISASPGIGFDLEDCFPSCDVIEGALTLANVVVASGESSVVAYQIANIPHCAWIPEECAAVLELDLTGTTAVQALVDAGVLQKRAGDARPIASVPPQGFEFNVTPLLPEEVTINYESLPPLLFPPEYRAQRYAYLEDDPKTPAIEPRQTVNKAFRFNALFFVPEPGVITADVLQIDIDQAELLRTPGSIGPELGCTLAASLAPGYTLTDLLEWDTIVRTSEHWVSIGNQFIGSLANTSCVNPTRGKASGISIFPVDFEITPCPEKKNASGSWASDSQAMCIDDPDAYLTAEMPDDTVFAKLYDTQYEDLRRHLDELACTSVDTGDPLPPVSPADCDHLRAIWDNGKDKFAKAVAATFEPKVSAGSENFGSVIAQLQNYLDYVAMLMPYGPDPANRKGEQRARAETLVHVLHDKLIPSVEVAPASGFIEDDTTWASD